MPGNDRLEKNKAWFLSNASTVVEYSVGGIKLKSNRVPWIYWLASQDSNLGQRSQSPLCYHYTTRQCYT